MNQRITMYGTGKEKVSTSWLRCWDFRNSVVLKAFPSWNIRPKRDAKYGLIWVGKDLAEFAFKFDEPSILIQELYAIQHFGFGKKKRRKK